VSAVNLKNDVSVKRQCCKILGQRTTPPLSASVKGTESPFSSNQCAAGAAESGVSEDVTNCEFEENEVGVSGVV
jgi:hypothetical protein